MTKSLENLDKLEVWFTDMTQNAWDKKMSGRLLRPKEILPDYIKARKGKFKSICEDLNYKYIITIDGWTSPWFRGPMILKSNSVPIVV